MQLIGMLDSPYVRRVAVSMHLMAIPFTHRAVSVFRHLAEFQTINPVVKAPTLILDDDSTLMDSTLILDYLDTMHPERSLMPKALPQRQRALRLLGLALAAMEKSVQLAYEQNLRPEDKRHQPWQERISAQLLAAYGLLEKELGIEALSSTPLDQAGISIAIAWRFSREILPQQMVWDDFPLLQQWSAQAEAHPAFLAAPFE
ncbi:glutathione S-transferase family protein [Aquitalea sp. LB_tupeE]|uniref:glutathione S-transferase family protein n=1 Tax=Aquitalea sp. LB_tupeE TaxID=2748078 RepID=UPI0015BC9CB8|nr:glutathione S-transferase family protein [Aquitalea sp. LB_tupeE]NWK78568.1 glutathione S-transferase family protein [Aquitalea sp. LB_tupeE]